MTLRKIAQEIVRNARDRNWPEVDRLLDKLVAAAERDHPITTEVLARPAPTPSPLDPSE